MSKYQGDQIYEKGPDGLRIVEEILENSHQTPKVDEKDREKAKIAERIANRRAEMAMDPTRRGGSIF